jgi:hypothetical protein
MRYRLDAEYELHMKDFLGYFDTMEAAEKKVIELENAEQCEGAELVLTELTTDKKWLFTEKWEPLEVL